MKYIILALCLGVMVAQKEQVALFKKMAKSEFGSTILQTIQMELKKYDSKQSSDSVEKIQLFLKQMQVEIGDAVKENDATFTARNDYFTQQLAQVDAVIKRAREQKASDEAQLPLRQEELLSKQDQAADKLAERQRNNDRLTALAAERQQTRKEYEERRGEIVGLVAALQQGKKLLLGIQTGGAFVEVFEELERHHKSFVKRFRDRKGFHSLVSLGLSMAQDPAIKSDSAALEKVIGVIDDLAESLFQLQKQEMEAEDAREEQYTVAKTRLEHANQTLEGSVAQLEAQVQVLKQRLLELKNDISSQDAQIRNKSTEKTDWLKSSKDEKSAHDRTLEARLNELDVVNECLSIFESGSLTAEAKELIQKLQFK